VITEMGSADHAETVSDAQPVSMLASNAVSTLASVHLLGAGDASRKTPYAIATSAVTDRRSRLLCCAYGPTARSLLGSGQLISSGA
jgi:hypothetical protein